QSRLVRPGMTEEAFQLILSKQLPNVEKCAAADYVIDTTTLESARCDVEKVMADLRGIRDA
ncbi:MAG: dephospho-CoA kinase, partial [Pseudomonadota bacterium]